MSRPFSSGKPFDVSSPRWLAVATLLVALGNAGPTIAAADEPASRDEMRRGASERRPPVTALALHPRGDTLVAGSQTGLEFYSWPDLQLQDQRKSSLALIHDLAFDATGRRLLVAGGEPAQAGRLELLDLQNPARNRTVRLADDVVYRVRWDVQDRVILTTSGDSTCRVLDATDLTERLVYRGHSRAVLAAAFLTSDDELDSLRCLTAGVDMTLRVWNPATGAAVRTLDNHVSPVNDVATRPQDDSTGPLWVASVAEDRTVRLWQPAIGRLVRFTRLPSAPQTVAWSHDGERLYVACHDGDVRELSFESLEVLRTFPGRVGRPHDLLVDSQRNRLVIGGQFGLRTSDLKNP